MKAYKIITTIALILSTISSNAQSRETNLLERWKFTRTDAAEYIDAAYDDSLWETVSVPHDWAIAGPFDMNIDSQRVKVIEDGEKVEKLRAGRTGALPFIGTGWYRYRLGPVFKIDRNGTRRYHLEFDGAMSNSKVYVNGQYVGGRPYGYSSFAFDITDKLTDKKDNLIAVRLENKRESSRWYPGAGLYRHVRLVATNDCYIPLWGTYITTSKIEGQSAEVKVQTKIDNIGQKSGLTLKTIIRSPKGKKIAECSSAISDSSKDEIEQVISLDKIQLWDIDNPNLYTAESIILSGNQTIDNYTTTFGIRTARFTPDKGFLLNGEVVKLKGVCMHHDLGPLGAAVNVRAIERQLQMLKEMGCNAIRTSHNPPAPELLDLCDKMGLVVMDEAFDEWKAKKNANGYGNFFDKWAEKDLVALLHRDRNHPCVVLWSIGNEIREQQTKGGDKVGRFLNDICKREDPTRQTTAGFNNYTKALENGFGDIVDVFGFNYKPFAYHDVHEKYPNYCLLGSETASTVSSRGKYHFPVKETRSPMHDDFHVSSYDLEYPRWASTPDTEFSAQDDCDFVAGEFVWTGFDYLGEPTPYNETYSSRSSYFGIIDLGGIKKDRFWLYQSRWTDTPVLHILPHWNWKDGDIIPVHCYTNYPAVELFLNGESLGKKSKDMNNRHRLVWEDISWKEGELKAIAYNAEGKVMAEETVRTAGQEDHIIMTADRKKIAADGKDLSFVEISIVDKDGTLCPNSETRLNFKAIDEAGNDCLVAICNGDPTCLESFCGNTMKAFSGKCIAVVGKKHSKGKITLTVESANLNKVILKIKAK